MRPGMLATARHTMLMYQSDARQRAHTAGWIGEALERGDKVLYRQVDRAEPLAELGAAGASALESGQLEFVDARQVHELTGGRHDALLDHHARLVARAHREGYDGVALAADSQALRVMVPDVAQRLGHETDLDRLAARPGVRVLCCYDLRREQPDLLAAVAGVHHRHTDDVLWSVRRVEDTLLVRGEIDANNADRFSAALSAATADGVRTVDLAELTMLSAAGMRAFELTIEVLHRLGDRLRVVNASPTVLRTLKFIRFADQPGVELVSREAVPATEVVAPAEAHLGTLATELTGLTALLLRGSTVAEVLERIVAAAQDLVPGADLVSITLRGRDGHFHTPISTNDLAHTLDQLQYALGEGPCLDAAQVSGPAVSVSSDLASSTAWPRFGPGAADLGMRAVVSTALLPDNRPPRQSGALNLFSFRKDGLSSVDRDIALVLASHASLALATTQAITLSELRAAQLTQAIESRDVIGQAKGILMQRRGISADAAFDLLKHLSKNLNVKLTDLARTLADRHTELDLPQPD